MRRKQPDHLKNRRPISVTVCVGLSEKLLAVIRPIIHQHADGSRIANPRIAELLMRLELRGKSRQRKSCQLITLLISAQAA